MPKAAPWPRLVAYPYRALISCYQRKGYATKYALKRRLCGIKLSEFNDMEAYISEFKSVHQTLNNIGSKVEDEDLANIILQGLPEQLSMVAAGVEAVNEVLTTDIVINKLRSLNLFQGKNGNGENRAL